MVIQLNTLQETMSTGSMDITETFRTDDITKTDFFDFVTAPDTIGIGINDRVNSDTNGNNLDAPLQGFDQVIFVHKSPKKNGMNYFNTKMQFHLNLSNSFGELKKMQIVLSQRYLKIWTVIAGRNKITLVI